MGNTNFFILSLLEPGWVYFFQVQNHDDWARLSEPSNVAAALVSDYVDGDLDSLPDDWEAAYGVSDPALDEDGDGLDNVTELQLWTHPLKPDTDGDGFSDGTENVGSSDPLDPNSTPATYENYDSGLLPLPELSVSPAQLTFRAYTQGYDPSPLLVSVLNLGGGDLSALVSDDAAWLDTALFGTDLEVYVSKAGLPAGHYTATLTITGAPGTYTQNSPQTVFVDLWLLQGPQPAGRIYLPVIQR
jgi:hypothetical protein